MQYGWLSFIYFESPLNIKLERLLFSLLWPEMNFSDQNKFEYH